MTKGQCRYSTRKAWFIKEHPKSHGSYLLCMNRSGSRSHHNNHQNDIHVWSRIVSESSQVRAGLREMHSFLIRRSVMTFQFLFCPALCWVIFCFASVICRRKLLFIQNVTNMSGKYILHTKVTEVAVAVMLKFTCRYGGGWHVDKSNVKSMSSNSKHAGGQGGSHLIKTGTAGKTGCGCP